VLLTIDLTKAVADEAIALKSSIVVAYHPIIFRGLKSLTFANSQQQTLLRLASHGISVYSPHTAVDAAPGGLGDWLADIVTGTKTSYDASPSAAVTPAPQSEGDHDPFVQRAGEATLSVQRPTFQLQHHPSQTTLRLSKEAPKTTSIPHTRRPVVPQTPEIKSHPGAGMGRIVEFNDAQSLPNLLDRIGKGLNNPKGFPIAIPQNASIGDINSERGFLAEVLREQLEDTVAGEWQAVREEGKGDKDLQEALADDAFEVAVSEVDRDPYGIVVLKGESDE
jgi:putative NIF3 family GTP cyclohydrolase 1 type 2